MTHTIQFIERAKDEDEARALQEGFLIQQGLIGVRILSPSDAKPGWRVQAFFPDDKTITNGELESIGARRVMLPDSLKQQLKKR